MAITPSQIEYWFSTGDTAGAAPQTDPSGSLGGSLSETPVGPNVNNVWADVPTSQAAAGRVEYRMLYVRNAHETLTLEDAVIWVAGDPASLDVALDPAAVGDESTTTIATLTTPPVGVVFAGTAVSLATGLAIGDLGPGEIKAFWEKRTTAVGAPNAIKVPQARVSGHTEA